MTIPRKLVGGIQKYNNEKKAQGNMYDFGGGGAAQRKRIGKKTQAEMECNEFKVEKMNAGHSVHLVS